MQKPQLEGQKLRAQPSPQHNDSESMETIDRTIIKTESELHSAPCASAQLEPSLPVTGLSLDTMHLSGGDNSCGHDLAVRVLFLWHRGARLNMERLLTSERPDTESQKSKTVTIAESEHLKWIEDLLGNAALFSNEFRQQALARAGTSKQYLLDVPHIYVVLSPWQWGWRISRLTITAPNGIRTTWYSPAGVGPRSKPWNVGIRFSVARVAHGDNLYSTSLNDVQRAFQIIQAEQNGYCLSLDDFNISRVDINGNLQLTKPVSEVLRPLGSLSMKFMNRLIYDELKNTAGGTICSNFITDITRPATVLFKNGNQSFSFYNKALEMSERSKKKWGKTVLSGALETAEGITSQPLLRVELSLKNHGQVRKSLHIKTYRDLEALLEQPEFTGRFEQGFTNALRTRTEPWIQTWAPDLCHRCLNKTEQDGIGQNVEPESNAVPAEETGFAQVCSCTLNQISTKKRVRALSPKKEIQKAMRRWQNRGLVADITPNQVQKRWEEEGEKGVRQLLKPCIEEPSIQRLVAKLRSAPLLNLAPEGLVDVLQLRENLLGLKMRN